MKTTRHSLHHAESPILLSGHVALGENATLTNISLLSPEKFFALPLSRRLPLVTSPSVRPESLQVGQEIIFSFKNAEIELSASLAHFLPQTVLRICYKGNIAHRHDSTGEYFTEQEQRIPVQTGTTIVIDQMTTDTNKRNFQKEEFQEAIAGMSLEKYLDLPQHYRLYGVTNRENVASPIQRGESFVIDFQENDLLRDNIGYEEILPEWVSDIEISSPHQEIHFGRRGESGMFITDTEHALPIDSGYTVSIWQ